jgi:hypothetical protein
MTDLRERLLAAGQGHAWERLQALPAVRQPQLAAQLEALDLALLERLRASTSSSK